MQGFLAAVAPQRVPQAANKLLNLQETRGLVPAQTVSAALSEEAQERGPMLVKRGHLDGRTAGEREACDHEVVAEAMTEAVRRSIAAVDPELPVFRMKTMEALTDDSLVTRRWPMR